MDEALRTAFSALPSEVAGSLAVLALGGYGRAELFPSSDVDLLVLTSGTDDAPVDEESVRVFLHRLWDAGLNVGHSVRTIQEAIARYGHDLDSWIAMLESRFICGNSSLAAHLHASMKDKIVRTKTEWLVKALFEGSAERQVRFGNSVKLLEPNVKKSMGGLRDLHTVLWLHRGIEDGWFEAIKGDEPATLTFINHLHDDGTISAERHKRAVAALRFLFSVRTAMHLRRGSAVDTLEYSLQREVAEMLGYKHDDRLRSVELFMRDYYLHTRTVHSLYRQLSQRFRESIEPRRRPWNRGRKTAELLRLREGVLALDQAMERLPSPSVAFEAFAIAAEEEVELDWGLRNALERSAEDITPEIAESPECQRMFRRILSSGRVAATLRQMNDTDVLGRIIPEFADLVAFFQHNVYHYYTADEHTLVALEHSERLREEQGILHEVYRNLRRRDLLYLSILLHDIAKPRGVSDHEITGDPIARAIVRRIGLGEIEDDIGFLVRNHLVMEQVAFRRNINDPETLKEFASRFERPYLLDYLYLLTYADLSAVNPGIWTEWKATMLQELYQHTSEVLHRNLKGEEVDRFHEERHEEAVQQTVDALRSVVDPAIVKRHLQGIGDASYTAVFSTDEIAGHIRAGEHLNGIVALFSPASGATDVTIVAHDAPFALSRFCAVLAANDANIFSADIFTRDDGLLFDRFRVTDAADGGPLKTKTMQKIRDDIRDVYAGSLDIDHLFLEHHRKWKRRPKRPANPHTREDVVFNTTARFTIIDVYAQDSIGFLYRITETMSGLGLNICFAKIATRVDGIVDAFYVLERNGKAIEDASREKEIRSSIIGTIQNMALRELTGE